MHVWQDRKNTSEREKMKCDVERIYLCEWRGSLLTQIHNIIVSQTFARSFFRWFFALALGMRNVIKYNLKIDLRRYHGWDMKKFSLVSSTQRSSLLFFTPFSSLSISPSEYAPAETFNHLGDFLLCWQRGRSSQLLSLGRERSRVSRTSPLGEAIFAPLTPPRHNSPETRFRKPCRKNVFMWPSSMHAKCLSIIWRNLQSLAW